MNRPQQVIRDGRRTIRRTVHRISETGQSGHIETGYVRYAAKWLVVRKTKPMTWWKLLHFIRTDDFALSSSRSDCAIFEHQHRSEQFEMGHGDYSTERHQWLDKQTLESLVDELKQKRNPKPRS